MRVVAADYGGERDEFALDAPIEPCHDRLWANYVRGVVLYLREAGSGARASIEQAYRKHGLDARAAMIGGGTEPLKRLIAGGRGIAWLSQLVVEEELADGRLVQLDVRDLQIERDLHVLWRLGSRLNPAPAAFLQMIDSNIKTV